MPRRLKKATHPQFGAPRPGGLALAALAWLPFFMAPLLGPWWLLAAPLAFVGAALATTALCAGSRRHGVRVSDEGFQELWLFRPSPLVRWSEVTDVTWLDGAARIDHALGQTMLGPPLFGWAAIAARAERELPTTRSADPDSAAWLGDEELQEHADRPMRRHAVAALAAAALLLLGLILLAWLGHDWQWMKLPGVLVKLWAGASVVSTLVLGSGVALLDLRRGVVRAVRLSNDAVEISDRLGWRRCGWGDLMSVTGQGPFQVVATTQGDFWLPPWLRDRLGLMRRIEAALAARRAGQALPRLTGDVPEAALSRAALGGDGERGLSVADASGEG